MAASNRECPSSWKKLRRISQDRDATLLMKEVRKIHAGGSRKEATPPSPSHPRGLLNSLEVPLQNLQLWFCRALGYRAHREG